MPVIRSNKKSAEEWLKSKGYDAWLPDPQGYVARFFEENDKAIRAVLKPIGDIHPLIKKLLVK